MNLTKTKKRWSIVILLLAVITGFALYPTPPQDPIQYLERDSGQIKTELVAGEQYLTWLYYNPVGQASLWALGKRKLVSALAGKIMDRKNSVKRIAPFIEDFNIDMSIAQKEEFSSFNDFFTRKLKAEARPIDTSAFVIVSPADGKVLAYQNISNTDFIIKGYRFDVFSFLDNPDLAHKYQDGSLLIIRLAPADYHRFHFPLSAEVTSSKKIDGFYHSVNPIAIHKKLEIFWMNKRAYTILANPIFGDVVMAEVGATMVGSILQTYSRSTVSKGEEKGYFKFGGSTVVLLFEKDKIQIDEDLLINTASGYETAVDMGEQIGVKRQ